jgi:cyclopropane fatty-acyl-phospholipid synthase-like methyltransferase
VLDVGCGKGGVAYLWAENFLAECKGVDLSEGEIKQALERQRLSVAMEMVDFTLGDGASYVKALVTEGKRFDVALCIGATFIFGSFEKTVMALGQCLKEDGVMAIGEVTLNEFCGAEEFAREMKASEGLELRTDSEILCVIERMGLDLTYVADSTPTDWDRYESLQYTALYQYYREHPGDDEARAHWGRAKRNKARYLGKERTHMGWKIFVLRPLPTAPPAPPAPA